MDVSNVKVGQSNGYTRTDAVSGKAETKEAEKAEVVSTDAEAATFEKTDSSRTTGSAIRSGYTVDTETIERMKAESEERMVNLVRQMLGQQIEKADASSLITKESILDAIQSGKFSQEDIDQAKKDTADDGYWGVEQTSDRFVQYATALTGGDPDKLDSMIEAFEKGYAEAEKQWGGELPELTQRTREATLKKFQDLKDQYAKNATEGAAAQNVVQTNVMQAMDKA